jgi:hypothetical protein
MSVRAAQAVQLPLGQLAMVGLGFFCVTNPDKFFAALQRGTMLYLSALPTNSGQQSQPTIIYQQIPMGGNKGTLTGYLIQLSVGAGFCWGSYILLVNVLPEAAKGMLPVTKGVFNKAVTSLGKAVLNLKDTLLEEILGLSKKQDELSDKQESTYIEVLNVKDSVGDLRGDLGQVQGSLDLCHSSLSEAERRTSYIARGVQLLTRGVSTILPQDDALLYELVQFNIAGEEFDRPAPLEQRRVEQTRLISRRNSPPNFNTSTPAVARSDQQRSSEDDPENEVPRQPLEQRINGSLDEVRALLDSFGTGKTLLEYVAKGGHTQ